MRLDAGAHNTEIIHYKLDNGTLEVKIETVSHDFS